MSILTTTQLLLIITALAIAVILLAYMLWDISRQKHQLMLDNWELHLANSRTNWETEIMKAELRVICAQQGIPAPPYCKGNTRD